MKLNAEGESIQLADLFIAPKPPISPDLIDIYLCAEGCNLPDTYKSFLRSFDGGRLKEHTFEVEAGFSLYGEHSTPSSATKELRVDRLFGLAGAAGSLVNDAAELRKIGRIPSASVPIGDDEFQNRFILSLEEPTFGEIFFADFEALDAGATYKELRDFPNIWKVARDFSALCSMIAQGRSDL